MTIKNEEIIRLDTIFDEIFGKVGIPEREAFRKEAHAIAWGKLSMMDEKRK